MLLNAGDPIQSSALYRLPSTAQSILKDRAWTNPGAPLDEGQNNKEKKNITMNKTYNDLQQF